MAIPVEPSLPQPAGPAITPLPGTAEREQVIALLTRAYAADWLTDEELQARLDRVYVAASAAELQGVGAGLPADAESLMAVSSKRVRALLSGQEERLTTLVPRRLTLTARLGYVELDLTRAAFQEGVTEIRVDALAGYVEIRLPPGVRAESTGHALLGYFSLRGGREGAAQGAPTVRITGRALLGYMECHVADRGGPPAAIPEDWVK